MKYIITQDNPTSVVDIIDSAESLEEARNIKNDLQNQKTHIFYLTEIDNNILEQVAKMENSLQKKENHD